MVFSFSPISVSKSAVLLVGGFFAKRIVFIYCFLKVWCQMFEDTSGSLSKLCVLPSCCLPPEVAWGREEGRLAGLKPGRAMQTAADRSLRCFPTSGLLPSFFQVVRHCLLLRRPSPPGFGEEWFSSTRGCPFPQPLETAEVRGEPGARDKEMAAGGRVIYRGGWESRAQHQPGAAGPGGPKNPE